MGSGLPEAGSGPCTARLSAGTTGTSSSGGTPGGHNGSWFGSGWSCFAIATIRTEPRSTHRASRIANRRREVYQFPFRMLLSGRLLVCLRAFFCLVVRVALCSRRIWGTLGFSRRFLWYSNTPSSFACASCGYGCSRHRHIGPTGTESGTCLRSHAAVAAQRSAADTFI